MEKCNINTDLLLFKIFNIHKIICNKANKSFSKDGVNLQVEQIPVLMVVYYNGPQSQQEIADELLRDKSSILRTVSFMESAGYVLSEQDVKDKRKKFINLTPKGLQLAKKIAEDMGLMDGKLFSNLSVAEKLILTELLDKSADHINTMDINDFN